MALTSTKSTDYDEKFHIPIKSTKTNINNTKWSVVLLISFIIFGSNVVLFTSPSPQFELTMRQGNNQSEMILNTMRKSLKLISFFALDFNDGKSHNNVDTFDVGTQFEFGYNSYKRINPPYERATSGLDIISCLIQDVGVQLTNITTSTPQYTESFIKSLLSPYQKTTANFNRKYKERLTAGDETLEGSFTFYGYSAYSIEQFGNAMTNYPFVAMATSLITTMLLTLIVAFIWCHSFNTHVLAVGCAVQFVQLVCFLGSYGAQLRFFYKLNQLFTSLNLADLKPGWGYRYLQIVLLLALINQSILGHMLRRRLKRFKY